ncbi:glutaredoxin family protein [Azonexus sp.]|jgi:glutaredoxin|uniref:glutaredoxin family protein n=1 Tax=Azonexus sp. TaxID=1872668 RepID=UPI002816DFDD|nr:glutaredoxin family protein [Azonexus sp.]MDR1995279.1 glutaredoxin family protein [Azonexus sp.]
MRFLLVLCLALLSAVVSAQTYRWVDPSGRTIISDTPPPGKAKEVSRTGNGQAATADDGDLPFAVRKARENFPVTLFTAADCTTDCQQARDLLNSRGVPFTEKMLQKAEDATELKALVGDVFVPSLKVGNQSFRGFQATAYHNLLDLAGYPKTAAYGSKPSGGLPPAAEPKDTGDTPATN